MYHLITFPAGWGEQSYSPFCIKAVWLLNYAGVDWQRDDRNDPRKMPHGKLPVLRTDAGLIHDSGAIADFLGGSGVDFWNGADAVERACGHALIRTAEHPMSFLLTLDRWGNDAAWPVI